MAAHLSNLMIIIRWLGQLFCKLIRSKAFPQRLSEELTLSPDRPVLYVLRKQSITDFFVLDYHCQKSGLPRPQAYAPQNFPPQGKAVAMYLRKTGLYQEKRHDDLPEFFHQLIAHLAAADHDVQIVPVSVYWGRNPGKEEKSLLKLLFLDDESGGRLQKIFLFLFHGRQVLCDFGKPFSLRELCNSPKALSSEDAVKKLNRLLRVHFRRQREIVLGPQVYLQKEVIKKLLDAAPVREAIAKEAAKKTEPIERSRTRARKYAYEVTSRFSHNTIRFLDLVLPRALRRIYNDVEVVGLERVRSYAKDYELVYMPCHRSHMDYLLLGYVLYWHGMMTPHTVAGINLNFWPIGPILRRGGAIFIRRTFSGNILYGKIVSEFINYLISAGFPLCFYPEGGRSRTGLLLEPKTGILGMVVESHYRKVDRPIMLVPVFLSYDKIIEGKNYLKELSGKKKRSESIGQLLKARKVLRSNFGNAYLNFGEPLDLAAYLGSAGNGSLPGAPPKGPSNAKPQLKSLAHEMMVRVNQAGQINPSAMLALILLATPKKALSVEHLLAMEALLIGLATIAAPQHAPIKTYGDFAEVLSQLEAYHDLERFSHPSGDILYLQGANSNALQYYRNNIVHFFVLPAIIANLLRHHNGMTKEELLNATIMLYQFFTAEYFLPNSPPTLKTTVNSLLEAFHHSGLIAFDAEWKVFRRPEVLSDQFSYFKILAVILGGELERIGIHALTFIRYGSNSRIPVNVLTTECEMISQRLSLLSESHSEVTPSEGYTQRFIQGLAALDLVEHTAEQVLIKPSLIATRPYFAALLSWEISSSFKALPPVGKDPVEL